MSESINFRGQREGERVIFCIHHHPWALAKSAVVVAAGAIITLLMFVWFQASRPAIWTFFILGPVLLLYGLNAWYIWWNNMYLLTDQRVIVIYHRNLFSRRVEDYSLEKIQSVASDTQGVAAATLNFGSILLAIIGLKEHVRLPYVEDPYAIQEKILTAMKKAER